MSDENIGDGQIQGILGIGNLLGETTQIFLKRFWLFIPIAIVVQVVLTLLNFGIFGGTLFAAGDAAFGSQALVAMGVSTVINLAGTALLMGMLALAAYDTKLNRPVRVGTYIGSAIAVIIPLIVLSLASSVAMAIGFALFVVPGLFLMVIWSVMAPSVVIDRSGFSALSRSSALTKGYRWPVLGYIVILFVIIMLLSILIGVIGGLGFATLAAPTTLNGLLFQAVTSGITTGIFSVGIVVLFARLKELKEGVGMSDLAHVFD